MAESPKGESGLGLYALLSRLGFPGSYRGKILLVAVLGTNVPLIALVLYLLSVSHGALGSHAGVLAVLLLAATAGFVATLYALRALLAPIRLASSSLKAYLDSGDLPDLPTGFSDEAGRLTAELQYAVERLDSTIRSLEGLSGTDHLTGLLNRREAEKRLSGEAQRTRRSGETLTVGVVDVNGFKRINDSFGHQAGDACIRHVADVIRSNIRGGDWLARWGGDEFLLVLRDTSAFAPTEEVLQRVVGGLKCTPVGVSQEQELVLTVSVGATRYLGQEKLREVFERADEAMYEAKREGRPWVLTL